MSGTKRKASPEDLGWPRYTTQRRLRPAIRLTLFYQKIGHLVAGCMSQDTHGRLAAATCNAPKDQTPFRNGRFGPTARTRQDVSMESGRHRSPNRRAARFQAAMIDQLMST